MEAAKKVIEERKTKQQMNKVAKHIKK